MSVFEGKLWSPRSHTRARHYEYYLNYVANAVHSNIWHVQSKRQTKQVSLQNWADFLDNFPKNVNRHRLWPVILAYMKTICSSFPSDIYCVDRSLQMCHMRCTTNKWGFFRVTYLQPFCWPSLTRNTKEYWMRCTAVCCILIECYWIRTYIERINELYRLPLLQCGSNSLATYSVCQKKVDQLLGFRSALITIQTFTIQR